MLPALLLLVMHVPPLLATVPKECQNAGYCPLDERMPDGTCKRCVCNEGSTGIHCETLLTSFCANVTAACGGDPGRFTCTSGLLQAECACKAGYSGPNCQYSAGGPCSSEPCRNGGTCSETSVLGTKTYTCACTAAYNGKDCSVPTDPCGTFDCGAHGACAIFDLKQPYCTCDKGYQGERCESTTLIVSGKTRCYQVRSTTFDGIAKFEDAQMTYQMCYARVQGTVRAYFGDGDACYVGGGDFQLMVAGENCARACGGDASQMCGGDGHAMVVSNPQESEEVNACDSSPCASGGHCLDLKGGFKCLCKTNVKGKRCADYEVPCALRRDYCNGKGECLKTINHEAYCVCDVGYFGETCTEPDPCLPNKCANEGVCVRNGKGFSCRCPSHYSGDRCQTFQSCRSSPCVNGGTCASFNYTANGRVEFAYRCTCPPGWTGKSCSDDVDECLDDADACEFQSTCTNTIGSFECTSVPGATGASRKRAPSKLSARCGPYITGTGAQAQTRCHVTDTTATCNDDLTLAMCTCSAGMTGTTCDLPIAKLALINDWLGTALTDKLLEIILISKKSPTALVDILPQLFAFLTEAQKKDMSWRLDEIVDSIDYEMKEVDAEVAFTQVFDERLGNCYTFNYANKSNVFDGLYHTRFSGLSRDFSALLKLDPAEQVAWTESVAISTYIHAPGTPPTQGMRYTLRPGDSDVIGLQKSITKLNANCVTSIGEFKQNYYEDGDYTREGCYTACYQGKVLEKCGCMDARFRKAATASQCQFKDNDCINSVTAELGEPTSWPDCKCPKECYAETYRIASSIATMPYKLPHCTNDTHGCPELSERIARLTIYLESLESHVFLEIERMTLMTFFSQLGGQMSFLLATSIVGVFELVILCATLGKDAVTNKEKQRRSTIP